MTNEILHLIVRDAQAALERPSGEAKSRQLASVLRVAIEQGQLRWGDKLPPIRDLADRLGIGKGVVSRAYQDLQVEGAVVNSHGSGTYVGAHTSPGKAKADHGEPGSFLSISSVALPGAGWRHSALARTEQGMVAEHPYARDLMRGSSDEALLPLDQVRAAAIDAAHGLTREDLQYPVSSAPEPEVVDQLLRRFRNDGIAATADQVVMANSMRQLLYLLIESMRRGHPEGQLPAVAVEDPGYQAGMDVCDSAGGKLIGVQTDSYGAMPHYLDSAIQAGASLVVLTPRAGNPTGASWSDKRRQELADVLAAYPTVRVIEDDYFADGSVTRPGSLFTDARLRERVLHVRGVTKVLGPDLRIAAALAGPALREELVKARAVTDTWPARRTQRELASVLGNPETDVLLRQVRKVYARRRGAAVSAMDAALSGTGGSVRESRDGLFVWVTLPPGYDAHVVARYLARGGFLLAPGGPFFVSPGDSLHLRLNAGSATEEELGRVGELLSRALRLAPERVTP